MSQISDLARTQSQRRRLLRTTYGLVLCIAVVVGFVAGRASKTTSSDSVTSSLVTTTSVHGGGAGSPITSGSSDVGSDLEAAKTLIELERYDEAQAILDGVLAGDPKNAIALYNSGLIAQQRGDVQTAVDKYTAALILQPNYHSSIYNRGLAYLAMGDPPKAVADLEAASKLAPDWEKGKFYLGKAYVANGQADKGQKLMAEAVAADPSLE